MDDPLLECIAFMLIDKGHVLAEKRKSTKTVVPGAVALPGGHIHAGEHVEDAVRRELFEELGVAPRALVLAPVLSLVLDRDITTER